MPYGDIFADRIHTSTQVIEFDYLATTRDAYNIAVDNGFVGTEEEWLQSLIGADGAKGETGATGATGPAGPGLAPGGSVGQIIVKNSASNYDTAWVDAPPSAHVFSFLMMGA